MKHRTAAVLIGLLVVLCLVLSITYPFTTATPHATNPHGERFTVGNADTYRATGEIAVEGEVKLAFEGVVAPDGSWYQKVVEDNVTSEAYYSSGDGTIYRRYRITGLDQTKQFRERITEDEDEALLRENKAGNRTTFLVEETTANATEPVSGTASVFVNELSLVRYADGGSDSSAVTLYEPRSGWYDGRQMYRITDPSGTVRANPDTHVVRSANVSWETTTPAGSYAEYTLVSLTTDDPTARTITFEFDPGDDDLEQPAWVTETEFE